MKSCQTGRSKKNYGYREEPFYYNSAGFLIVRKNIFNVGRMCSFTYICIYMYIQMFTLLKNPVVGEQRSNRLHHRLPNPRKVTSLRCFHKSWIDNTSNKYGFVDTSVNYNIK